MVFTFLSLFQSSPFALMQIQGFALANVVHPWLPSAAPPVLGMVERSHRLPVSDLFVRLRELAVEPQVSALFYC